MTKTYEEEINEQYGHKDSINRAWAIRVAEYKCPNAGATQDNPATSICNIGYACDACPYSGDSCPE